MSDEAWLDRAIEDRLGEIIDRYRSQGKDVHNVGRLREKIAADIHALRGTPHWVAMRSKYEPAPTNRLAWCAGCDKPLSSGAVTAWLEDRVGRVFCSSQCRDDPKNEIISFQEWKARVKKRGYAKARRRDVVDGAIVDGDEIVLTWDEVKNFVSPFVEQPGVDDAGAASAVADDEIVWD